MRDMAQPNLNIIAEHYSVIVKELDADLDSEGMKKGSGDRDVCGQECPGRGDYMCVHIL